MYIQRTYTSPTPPTTISPAAPSSRARPNSPAPQGAQGKVVPVRPAVPAARPAPSRREALRYRCGLRVSGRLQAAPSPRNFGPGAGARQGDARRLCGLAPLPYPHCTYNVHTPAPRAVAQSRRPRPPVAPILIRPPPKGRRARSSPSAPPSRRPGRPPPSAKRHAIAAASGSPAGCRLRRLQEISGRGPAHARVMPGACAAWTPPRGAVARGPAGPALRLRADFRALHPGGRRPPSRGGGRMPPVAGAGPEWGPPRRAITSPPPAAR